MSYFVVPAKEDDFVFLACEDEMPLTEARAAWEEAQGLLVLMQRQRLLVDITALRGGLEMVEIFDVARLVWRGFPRQGRIAMVARWDQAKSASLLESLLRNVGVYLRIFGDEKTAEGWVRGSSPGEQMKKELAI